MTQTNSIESVAQQLLEAYTTLTPITPPRNLLPELDVNQAYRIQQLQEHERTAAGETIRGRKIGLTSIAMQQQLGVDSPDFGFFTETMMYDADRLIPVDSFISPKVEPELGFLLAKDLSATATMADIIDAIETTFLAVEIIDSRVADWDIHLVDTIADNASCGAIILSQEPVDIPADQLAQVSVSMKLNNNEVGSGTGTAVMGHPLKPLVWLAATLGAQGVKLSKGDIILTGSFCAAASISAGDHLEVDYGNYGSLSVNFI